MQLAKRNDGETLADWATRALEAAFGQAVEVPCLNRACKFYQDANLGGVTHYISDHAQLAATRKAEAQWQR